MIKDGTVTPPDDPTRWLRVRAAEDGRNMSRWIADPLARMRRRKDTYNVAVKRYFAMKPRGIERPDGRRPTREGFHDRTGFR